MEAGRGGGHNLYYQQLRVMPTRRMGAQIPLISIGSILHIVYLLCDFLPLHLRRGAQEGSIFPL